MKNHQTSIADKLPAEFAERLNKLKQSFLDSLPDRLSCVDAALEVVARDSSSLAELQQVLTPLRAKTHDLAGAAGTFGFRKLSRLAHEAEIVCEELLACDDMPSRDERLIISELFAAIRESGSRCLANSTLTNEPHSA